MQKKGVVYFSILVLMLAGMAGCSSVPMPKGNSKGYSSVRFISEKKSAEFYESDRSKEVNQLLQKAITSEFEKHGMAVDAGADLIIAYLIIIQDNVSTVAIDKHFGYRDTTEMLDMVHERGTGGRNPEYVQKGAVVIDLINAEKNKLIYRNYAVRGTAPGLSGEALQARLAEVAEETLAAFFK